MQSTATEYYQNLYQIQNDNTPAIAVLVPSTEQIFKINLNDRSVETPEFLSVQTDHTAETIYFEVDRFYENMDLATLICVVQYVNADGEGYVYPVPYYDTTTVQDKILFPWVISGNATKSAGEVNYSIRFYRIDAGGKYFTYNINTLPVTSKVLYGMDISDSESITYSDDALTKLLNAVQKVQDELNNESLDLYWLDQ